MGIESGRYKDKVRLVCLKARLDQLVEYASIPCIAHIRRERDVKRVISSATDPNLVHSPNARIEIGRVKVSRNKQNGIILKEDVLGAVAMVHIEIDDRHPLGLVHHLSMASSHGNVVENAEATHPVGLGMVARRTNQGKTILGLRSHDLVYGRRASTSRHACQREAFAGHVGVALIQQPTASRRDMPNVIDQLICVRSS